MDHNDAEIAIKFINERYHYMLRANWRTDAHVAVRKERARKLWAQWAQDLKRVLDVPT